MNNTRTIRWILYHEPIHLFIRTAKAFAEEIKRITDDRINVEVYTLKEYSEKFTDGVQYDPMTLIDHNKAEMSQVRTSLIGTWDCPDFFALEMPYLFKDHNHATRVLDGDIGAKMLQSIEDKTPVRGLAFTYSGGYRVMATDRPVHTAEDLSGLKLITTPNPVMVETLEHFGCEPVPFMLRDLQGKSELADSNGYSVETTLPRYEHEANTDVQKYIADTEHSMYLTSIIISKNFWTSLSTEDQLAIQEAARKAAVLERDWSVQEADEFSKDTAKHAELGITYITFDDVEKNKLREVVLPIYEKYAQLFTDNLLDKIIKS